MRWRTGRNGLFSACVGVGFAVSACATPDGLLSLGDDVEAADKTTTTTTALAAAPSTAAPATSAQPTSTTAAAPSSTDTTASAAPAQSAAAPAGFTLHGDAELGFTVALRDSYRPIDTDDVASLVEEEGLGDVLGDSELAALTEQALAQGDTFALWAFDFQNASLEFVPNVNIQIVESGPLDTPEIYLDLLEGQYQQLGVQLNSIELVPHPTTGEALIVDAFFPDATGGAPVLQGLVFGGSNVYIASFTYSGAATPEEMADFRTSIDSLTPLE